MFNYYTLDTIPIILRIFKVNNIIISGSHDKKTVNCILEYCNNQNANYTIINSNDESKKFEDATILNQLSELSNYDAIFINDDPNWYTVYNELKIIKENNESFPLVFICNNIFPHKRRDSYINPDIIPDEYCNDFSRELIFKDIHIRDNFYHALDENTQKNGVLTAIEDFLSENKTIDFMNFELENGITILYLQNSINHIRLGKLNNEIESHCVFFDDVTDNLIENELLTSYISKYNISGDELDILQESKDKLADNEIILNKYEKQIEINNAELNYKNSQIKSIDSKLDLKDSQIKNMESKLVNNETEINKLNSQLKNKDTQINSLKSDLKQNRNNKEELNNRISTLESKINSLKTNLEEKKKIESELNEQLQTAYTQIKVNNEELTNKNLNISFKDKQIKKLQKEKRADDSKSKLDLFKKQNTNQLSKLENKEYCISCYKREIRNKQAEIKYLNKNNLTRKILSPFAYLYLIIKSDPKEISINLKLYKALKNSKCFDIGYYLNNNEDIQKSSWCEYFSPELHYVCNGFNERREFNKKYFKKNSKTELLDYILKYVNK